MTRKRARCIAAAVLLMVPGIGFADYAANLGSSGILNDFRYAAVGSWGSVPQMQINWTYTNNAIRLGGRFQNVGGRYLNLSDDGNGANDGRYRTNVFVSMTFRYYSGDSKIPTSSNTMVCLGLRSQTNINFRNTPTYRAAITSNVFVIHKEFSWSATNLVLASYILPDYIGTTANVYRLAFSVEEQGTNTFGEILNLRASLYENGSLVQTLQCQDVPTNSALGNAGSTPKEGYIGIGAGQLWTNTNDSAWRGVEISEFVVKSDPELARLSLLPGHQAMAVNLTNRIGVLRGGDTSNALTVNLASSDPAVADVPASVEIPAGSRVAFFPLAGVGAGTVSVSATNELYADGSCAIVVYRAACDDDTYAPDSALFASNSVNGGAGFQSWIIQRNPTNAVGYTNSASFFLETSEAAGLRVDAGSRSFGLTASKSGLGGDAPYINAIRPFLSELNVGQAVSLHLGINWRNGSKGVAFQNGGNSIFEVAAYNGGSGDAYWYKIGTNAPVDLGWAYASDSDIQVVFQRVLQREYDVAIIRSGGNPQTNELGVLDLGDVPPNELRFFNYNATTNVQDNIYFNRLIIRDGYQIPVLSLDGQDGMAERRTNLFVVSRSGALTNDLAINLTSSAEVVATVPVSVIISNGFSNAMFEVVGLSSGLTHIAVSYPGGESYGAAQDVQVRGHAYDDSSYYPPSVFADGQDSGHGFGSWIIQANDGSGEGFTNYAGVGIGNSSLANGNVNSTEGSAFLLYANKVGSGGDAPLAQATRSFDALAVGDSISVELGVNYRNGAKGLVLQSGGAWLFEFAAFNDNYYYNIRDQGGDSPVELGWSYAADSSIKVTLSRTGQTLYNAQFIRTGSSETQTLVQAITLSSPPDRMRFYVYDSSGGGDQNNLYINRLLGFTGIVGDASVETDGIPNSWWDRYGIQAGERTASGNPDGDSADNYAEYVADTNPTNSASVFPNQLNLATGAGITSLQAGPTTNSRIYDVWQTTNLLAVPQIWTRYGLNVQGNGASVSLQVTNDASSRTYRTGVALP